MRPAGPAKPYNRQGVWYLHRRVPAALRQLDPRGKVLISTEIAVAADPRGVHAARVVRQLDVDLQAYWKALADGTGTDAKAQFEQAQRHARDMKLVYRTAGELAQGPLDEILRRVQLLVDRDGIDNRADVEAVLGGQARPVLHLTDLVREFETLQRTNLKAMSDLQVRKWRNPRQTAVDTFIGLVGNKALVDLSRDDALTYRRHWQGRIETDGIEIVSANRDIGALSKMLKSVAMAYELDMKPIFAGLRIEGASHGQRLAFTPEWVQTKLFATGALAGLNAEARAIIYICAETGLRPSECAALLPEHINLDAKIPHVLIRPVGRILKTADSVREMPLVGAALEAMKLHPKGFPRYRNKDLSNNVNKYLRGHGLLPSSKHTLYGLRHCFEDRLTAAEAPEKVVATLMGHKWHRPKYGAGPTLEQKARWLQAIAFGPPQHF